jgi:arabinose-5-phosphate isomerase
VTSYFERQLKEFEHSIHSMDMEMFDKWLKESVATLQVDIKLSHQV